MNSRRKTGRLLLLGLGVGLLLGYWVFMRSHLSDAGSQSQELGRDAHEARPSPPAAAPQVEDQITTVTRAAGSAADKGKQPSPAHGDNVGGGAQGGMPQPLQDCAAGATNEQCTCPSSLQPPLANGKHRLAVLVPFRDGCSANSQGGGRNQNLAEFVPEMRKFLAAQGVDSRIVVIEQVKRGHFNRGVLFNMGFLLVNRSFDYLALHDVDMVPEVPTLSYGYPEGAPVHLRVTNSRDNYVPMYAGSVGGVALMSHKHYDAVNGFANTYWNWGQEDDDMHARIEAILGHVQRPAPEIGRYRALEHARVMGLDETPLFREQRKELMAAMAAASGGRTNAIAHVMKNGFRQVKYKILQRGCREDYDHYVIDYLNPDKPMGEC